MRSFIAAVPLVLCCATLSAQAPLARVRANDNRVPSGTLQNGVLTLNLDIVRGMWYPDREDDPGVDIYAFAEAGKAPAIPAPLVRVPVGTEIRTTIHNTIADSSFLILGLSGDRTRADTVRIQPGETRELITHATSPGTFLYNASTTNRPDRSGDDRMLTGAFIVDEPNKPANDRVFVLLQWINADRLKEMPGTVAELLTINGKAWPNTERLNYNLADTIRWRIVNGSMDVHPMHLHGAFYTILSRGSMSSDSIFSPEQRRQAVTEVLMPRTTMNLQWTAPHAGNWLFHCHLTFHVQPHPPLGAMKASADDAMNHDYTAMGGLTLATTIHGPIAADPRPRRNIRLVVQQFDSVPGEIGPPFSYALDHDVAAPAPVGPPLLLVRDQPVAITVVNHAHEPTSVHWHGLEIQSYYDGVHGFSGHDNMLAPAIAPRDSFIAQLTPPRAGTFIYHTHFDDVRQQGGGLYGGLIVLEPGRKWDAEHDRLFVLGDGRDSLGYIYINGDRHPTWHFKAGETYHIRFINICLARPAIFIYMMDGDKPAEWKLIARDGADLPASQSRVVPAKLQITDGQTWDMLFTPSKTGSYKFRITAGNGVELNTGDVVVD